MVGYETVGDFNKTEGVSLPPRVLKFLAVKFLGKNGVLDLLAKVHSVDEVVV